MDASQNADGFTDRFARRSFRIADAKALPPFLMNVASSSDLWLFLASNGGLTAGRADAEQALFPYQTVDKLYDSAGLTGPCTLLRVEHGGGTLLWEPFDPHGEANGSVSRSLYKSIEGDRVWFEETHAGLGLCFRYGWTTSEEHGFVRCCELVNLGDGVVRLQLLDGLRNLLPPGIGTRLQNASSCLADAYKTSEVLADSSLAVTALSAAIVDRAIPLESLLASVVWSEGLPEASVHLSDAVFGQFRSRSILTSDTRRRGVRSSYSLSATINLQPRDRRSWLMVADTGLSQAKVAALHQALRLGGLGSRVLAGADASTQRLRGIVAAADGLQCGGLEHTTAHHFANVLFNVMRGGTFAEGHAIPATDFAAFVAVHDRAVAGRHAALLAALPATLTRASLLSLTAAAGDASLSRLASEYLPLTFSRRHGDPSRPWNRFSIKLKDTQGRRRLAHEGNWRDIFQNWEALCQSHPDFIEACTAKFLNASTPDGYNPYRISQAGVDWEAPDHEDPWASIGYWGDHQVVYLLKLLESSHRYHPGALAASLRAPSFSYARVPYRIAGYEALCRNPRETITFDQVRHSRILEEVRQRGTDARLVPDPQGGILHANLTEKLLVLLLARLANFVPGGGLWMNTQRPEWNDANNALVGNGVSVVTLCYLRRLLRHWQSVLLPQLGKPPVPVASAVASFTRRALATLQAHRPMLDTPAIDDRSRRALLDGLGRAGGDFRSEIYGGEPVGATPLETSEISALLELALSFIDHTLRANRRDDGLYHAYNLLEFSGASELKLRFLPPMLEGQVAILSSGLLSPAEAVDLLRALRQSALYRADQHSYVLYPDRQLPGFLERNVLSPEAPATCALLRELLEAGDERVVLRDTAGLLRFHADLTNADALTARLRALADEPRWTALVEAQQERLLAIYEEVFHHHAFTGRSGSMFGYEGLGCIYWHMVAKLLLAVQEILQEAQASGAPETQALIAHYYDLRSGLGFNKTAAAYGAFPTDPYSHTPGHSGAQQPGMTGQVKEEILTRIGELGVSITGGCISFSPTLLRADEFSIAPSVLGLPAPDGSERSLPVPARALAFTVCAVPVLYRLSTGARLLRLHRNGSAPREQAGSSLNAADSALVLSRSGIIDLIEIELGADYTPLP